MSPPRYHHLRSRIEDGVLVLTLTAPELRGEELTQAVTRELTDAFDRSGTSCVVLDLSRVAFLASLGLSTLLTFRRHLRAHGGEMLLCNLTPLVADVLYTAHLASSGSSAKVPFGLAPDVRTAIAALKAGCLS